MDVISLVISLLALIISGLTSWLTFFRRGTVKMTQPTVIYFGPDASKNNPPPAKVFLRTLLFSTSKRGRIIESMHISLSRNETHQNFNVWVYGDEKLVRGSGLFVGETGVVANHHFLAPRDGNAFKFTEGQYKMEVYVRLLGDKKQKLLFSQFLTVSNEQAQLLQASNTGLYFDWGPDSSRYIPHVEERQQLPDAEKFLELLAMGKPLKEIEGKKASEKGEQKA